MNRAIDGMRIVLMTGNGLRHRYVARQFANNLQLVGVAYEQKVNMLPETQQLPENDLLVIKQHLDERDRVERQILGAVDAPVATETIQVPHGQSNNIEVFDWVSGLQPDYIVLYGTSIIKPPLLDAFGDRLVNIHLGLSPYYRGSGTNFWPLVDRRPEFVGATLHRVAAKVDAGPILAQVRPSAVVGDRTHELGTKTLVAAAAIMPRVLRALSENRLTPRVQNLTGGRVCRRRDFNADAVRTLWDNLQSGMMEEFLMDAESRLRAAPIVELSETHD